MKHTTAHLVLVFLLGYICSAFSVGCPPEDAISPCICLADDLDVDITLSCYEQEISVEKLRKVLSLFDEESVLGVELDRQKIRTLPSDIFSGLKVLKLEITNCEFNALAEEGGRALSGLENSLEILYMSNSLSDKSGPTNLDLSHLRSLKYLEISDNIITKIENDRFPASLNTLVLTDNGIKELGDTAFASLANIEHFWLGGNSFGPIKRSMFPASPKELESLKLDNNFLTRIPDDLFSNMPRLTYLSFHSNGLTQVSQRTLLPVWKQLSFIDLRGNPIHCDSDVEWMFQDGSSVEVMGQCSSPPDKDGMSLKDLRHKRE